MQIEAAGLARSDGSHQLKMIVHALAHHDVGGLGKSRVDRLLALASDLIDIVDGRHIDRGEKADGAPVRAGLNDAVDIDLGIGEQGGRDGAGLHVDGIGRHTVRSALGQSVEKIGIFRREEARLEEWSLEHVVAQEKAPRQFRRVAHPYLLVDADGVDAQANLAVLVDEPTEYVRRAGLDLLAAPRVNVDLIERIHTL